MIHVCARAPRVRERACVVTVPEYIDPPLGPAPREGGRERERERGREGERERERLLLGHFFISQTKLVFVY